MNKAFTRETDREPDDDVVEEASPLPAGSRNYITPAGYARLRSELSQLVDVERPQVVSTVAWAASNGDRSENGDYIYGKKRLREIDRRIRFLVRRLDRAEVVDPAARARADATDQVFFGATVRYSTDEGDERIVCIVGVDEIDTSRGHVSWVSPLARALIKAREGDVVTVRTPAGDEDIEVLEVRYRPIA
jgi:transcription elongation factor GreB